MGLSLKKLGKGIGKSLKKVAKVAAPIVLSGVTGGAAGGLTGLAGRAVGQKASSKLKSLGIGPKTQALKAPEMQPLSVRAAIDRYSAVPGAPTAVGTRRKKAPAPVAKPKKRTAAPRAPSQTRLKALYAQWKAEGSPGDWKTYAAEALS